MLILRYSKFFGKSASGAQPAPTQQTKLSFSSKSVDKSKKQEAAKKEDDRERQQDEDEEKVKPSSQGSPSSTSAKNSEPVSGEYARQSFWRGNGMANVRASRAEEARPTTKGFQDARKARQWQGEEGRECGRA